MRYISLIFCISDFFVRVSYFSWAQQLMCLQSFNNSTERNKANSTEKNSIKLWKAWITANIYNSDVVWAKIWNCHFRDNQWASLKFSFMYKKSFTAAENYFLLFCMNTTMSIFISIYKKTPNSCNISNQRCIVAFLNEDVTGARAEIIRIWCTSW